jgi:hypothetical protein
MTNSFAPVGAKPSLHGNRLFLTDHGRLAQAGTGRDLGGVWPILVTAATAASTAISNTNTEAAFSNGSFSIPANWLRAGSIIKFQWQGIGTAINGSDTLQIKAYVNSTAIATGTATNIAANDIFAGEAEVAIRTIGASGTFVANATHTKVPAATNVATRTNQITASTSVDTTAAVVLSVKATWSAASSSNSCRLDMFRVELT